MTEQERGKKWDNEFIPCRNHPDRRSSRSAYKRGYIRCGSCTNKTKSGQWHPAHKRWDNSEQRRWKDRSRAILNRIKEKSI